MLHETKIWYQHNIPARKEAEYWLHFRLWCGHTTCFML